ncbi:MAG: aminoglycoside phosphotransferase family protein [Planctomycetes bacterium]|nr:aminoglycoside phosphotransferase family protein [Planctomycetota bacterium]
MERFDRDQLEAAVRVHRPGIHGDLEFEPIRTGKFNTSYYVRGDGEQMVLRIAPSPESVFCFYEKDMMRQEPEIHSRLREETEVPVAEIFAFDDTKETIGRDYLLMERLPGRALTDARGVDQSRVLHQVGEYLARTHELSIDRYGYVGPHKPMRPQDSWVEAFQVMWNKLIDDVVDVGHYDEDESSLLRRLLEDNLELFDRDGPARLLHMDIWSQNILVDSKSRVTGLVDWDRALWGDPEIEFAVLDYCGISRPAFWEGYGRRRDATRDARVRQVFYLLYELQKYIVIREGRGHDSARARSYKRQVMEMVRRDLLNTGQTGLYR